MINPFKCLQMDCANILGIVNWMCECLESERISLRFLVPKEIRFLVYATEALVP